MKKIISLVCFFVLFFLYGCSAGIHSENSGQLSHSSDNTSNSTEQVIKKEFDMSSTQSYDKETYDFLHGVYPNNNIPDDIADVKVPETYFENRDEYFQYEVQQTEYIEKEYGTELSVYESDVAIDVDKIAPIVNSNRTALLLYNSLFYDTGRNGSFGLSKAEAILGIDIVWARNTGIPIVDGADIYRMYSIAKCESGGYIYIFFDATPDGVNTHLKSIVYIDKVYSLEDVEKIKTGLPLSDIEYMFSAVHYYVKNPHPTIKRYIPNIIIYIKEGGMLKVACDVTETKSIYSVEYYEDCTMPNPEEYAQDEARAYNFTILPQDYPPAS